MTEALGLLAVVALILANGWFVAMEFAYVAVRPGPLEELAEAGDRRARRAVEVLRRLSFMLSGAQLGITATSLIVGFIAEPTLGRVLQPVVALLGLPERAVPGVAFTTAFVVATMAQMVLGELAPKNLAIARPQQLSLALALGTRVYLGVAGPLIAFFDGAANGLLRVLRIEPVEELSRSVSPEELEFIIEESGKEGALTQDQAQLLARALEFRQLRADDAMVPRTRVKSITSEATVDDLRTLAVETGHSRFPVVGDGLDDVRGVVQAKDVLSVAPDERVRTPVRSLLHPALSVPESALLSPLLGELRAAHTTLALVVDEHGGTAGIITLEDVVEELVGEIRDEHDRTEPSVQPLPGDAYLVPGSWRLDEVERDTGVALPPGDYDTVSGLIMARLGRVPAGGDVVDTDTAALEVLEMSGHAVGRVRLSPVAPPEDAAEEPR